MSPIIRLLGVAILTTATMAVCRASNADTGKVAMDDPRTTAAADRDYVPPAHGAPDGRTAGSTRSFPTRASQQVVPAKPTTADH